MTPDETELFSKLEKLPCDVRMELLEFLGAKAILDESKRKALERLETALKTGCLGKKH